MALATPDPSLFDALQTPIGRAASRGSDRRVHARLTPVELQNPITARMKYGERVTLVDLSEGGALLETSMFLRPDTDLVLELVDPRTRDVTDVVSRVLRSQVSGLQGGITYRGACVFDRPFSHPALSVQPPRRAATADDARHLELALKTIVEGFFRRSTASAGAGRWRDGSTLIDALTRLRTAAEQRDTPIDRQLAQLLRTTIPALQRHDSVDSVMAQLRDALSLHLPLLSIRTHSPAYASSLDCERVTLNMCTDAGDPPVAVTAEFAPGFGLDASQFRLLKVSAYLAGLVGQWCPSTAAPATEELSVAEAIAGSAGWLAAPGAPMPRWPTAAGLFERLSSRSSAPVLVSDADLFGGRAAAGADDACESRVLREGSSEPAGSRGRHHLRSSTARPQGRGHLSGRRNDDRIDPDL